MTILAFLAGAAIGSVIGLITAFIFSLSIRTVLVADKITWKTIVQISAEIASLPTLWFGATWATTILSDRAFQSPGTLVMYCITFPSVFAYFTVPLFRKYLNILLAE